ncbi:MAG: hypothetical protein ACFFD7_06925 [Candidatus Thorarchaeota archaeon]
MKRYTLNYIGLSLVSLFLISSNSLVIPINNLNSQRIYQNNVNLNLELSINGIVNVTVISDGFNGTYWNDGLSEIPEIAADTFGNIHVVWMDDTEGVWGGGVDDYEIFYANYSATTNQWSNITILSDGYNDVWGWNDDSCYGPKIAADIFGNLHVVWEDYSSGVWKDSLEDAEIMYVSYSFVKGQWSNVSILSDGWNNVWGWNNNSSEDPAIAVDKSGNVHVVWQDRTIGNWSGGIDDSEIMYVKYTSTTEQWSNVTIISDTVTGWNDDLSADPDIAVDGFGNIHVIWEDRTNGTWGDDEEIMWTMYDTSSSDWLNATVISDGYNDIWGWNTGDCDDPKIAVDSSGNAHAVWGDSSDGPWRSDNIIYDDDEIMYAKYSRALGQWSNITIVSDGHDGVWWNDGESENVDISVSPNDIIHVVWEDSTNGTWGTDDEIMYSYKVGSSVWSVPNLISDGINDVFWNDEWSAQPAITTDSNNKVHIVWEDGTDGFWGVDDEVMYLSFQCPSCGQEAPFPWLIIALIVGLGIAALAVIVHSYRRSGRET